VTGVRVVTIREVGNGSGVVCGHVVHWNENERLPERRPVHRMHSVGREARSDARYGHVVHA
jgi:hypothetical protein